MKTHSIINCQGNTVIKEQFVICCHTFFFKVYQLLKHSNNREILLNRSAAIVTISSNFWISFRPFCPFFFFFLNSKELGEIPIRIQPMSEGMSYVHSMTSSVRNKSGESPPCAWPCVSVKWRWERNSTQFEQCVTWIWRNKTSERKLHVRFFYVFKMGRHSPPKANSWTPAQTDHLTATR